MGIQDTDLHSFQSLDELPTPTPLPQVAQQVLAACESPNIDAQQLGQIIQCDPAISVRLLQTANSSMYGFSGDIRSIDHAIVALGLRTVKDLAISFAASAVFQEGANMAARKALWTHSLTCGIVASQIAPRAKVDRSEAFLAGIVHDVGKLLLLDAFEQRYLDVIQDTNHENIIACESEHLGVSHQEAGGRCGDEWGLPIEVTDAIENHHNPDDAVTSFELASVIHAANCLVRVWNLDGAGAQDLDFRAALDLANVQASDDDLESIQEFAAQQLEALQKVCG